MIIQRWQTLLLFIAAVMMALFSFGSLGQINTLNDTFNISALGIKNITNQNSEYDVPAIYVFAMSLISVVLTVIAIFSYKNLKFQRSLCKMTTLLIMACCLCLFLDVNYTANVMEGTVGWSSLVASPFIALIAVVCAWRLINSDKKKLDSLDRIR